MIGFILAAGLGTRLRPITNSLPKALVPVAGKPLLGRILSQMHHAGFGKIGVNTHHLAEAVVDFKEKCVIEFSLFHEDDTVRGTGGAFWFARSFLSSDEAFCASNVDIIAELDYRNLQKEFLESGADCALVATATAPGRTGTIFYDPFTHNYAGVPATGPGTPLAQQADFVGTVFYRKRFLEIVNENDFSIVPIWKRGQERGFSVKVIFVENLYWRDTGTPQALADIHFDVVNGAVSLEIPDWMRLDIENKIGWNSALPASLIKNLGPFSWVEPPSFDPAVRFERSVVFKNAALDPGLRYDRKIITAQGTVDIDKE